MRRIFAAAALMIMAGAAAGLDLQGHRGARGLLPEYSINYRAQLVGNEWKVYDVVAENISLVNNYRSQFNRVIAKSSYEELVRRLKDKNDFAGAPKK